MQRMLLVLGSAVMLAAISACNMVDRSPQGFNLPEGDAEEGQIVFASLGCTACHKVQGLELPEPETEGPVMVVLGGRVSRVKSYGELVTSIINPSHRLARGFPTDKVSQQGESLMTVYNDVMTVSELIDVVAFLQSQYDVIPRPGYRYPVYDYGQSR